MLTIEYDGSRFSGWQRQPDARTVQGELEKVLSKVCNGVVELNGTSRTDAGVHALGQRASFKGEYGIPTDRIREVANNHLCGGKHLASPIGDMRIVALEEKSLDFHARFDSKGKKYRYIIANTPDLNIFRRNYCYHVTRPLDLEAMCDGALHLVGSHDFASFQSTGGQPRATTVRTVYSLEIFRRDSDIILEIAGDGFLYNMVRIIVGTLVEVGLGKIKPEKVKEIINSCNRNKAGHKAPAEGLYLVEVYYE